MNRFSVFVAVIAALGGLLFGYDTGIIAGAIIYIKQDFGLTPSLQALVISIVLIGAMAGAVLAGATSDRFGRRSTLLWAGGIFAAGALASAFATNAPTLGCARLVVGLAVGLTSVTAPLYISETAPADIRGALVSLYQWAVTIGILLADVFAFALSHAGNWRLMLALAVVPSALLIAGMIVMPESPRWLIAHGKRDEARAVLAKSSRDPEHAYADIAAAVSDEQGHWSELFAPRMRGPLLIGITLAVLQQVTGINTVIYYGPQIFQQAGFASASAAIFATMVVAVVNVLATVIAILLIDRVGRKPLLYAGVGGMGLALFTLAADFSLGALQAVKGPVAVGSIVVFIACFAFSLGPITWLLISEIYPQRIRGRAMSIATLGNWAANFLVSLFFLAMLSAFGAPATFAIYGTLCMVTIVFVRFAIVETRHKDLESISTARRMKGT